MSCPICGELCRCAESRSFEPKRFILADVDEYDDSEDQFASSIAGQGFQHDEQEQELASGTLAAAREKHPEMTGDTNLPAGPEDPESWRDEVASRLQNYKARRRRSLGEESLSFNFESTTGNHVFLRSEHQADAEPAYESQPAQMYYSPNLATAPSYNDQTEPMDQTPSEAQATFAEFVEPEVKPAQEPAKLIFFPRPAAPQEASRDELADPVLDKPRIVEAPETMEAIAIPLADITLQPETSEEFEVPNTEITRELPFRVAPMMQRIFGELVDTLMVLVASGIFAFILAKVDSSILIQDTKTLFAMMALIPATFWSIYKYLFLVHNRATPGMQLACVQLMDFDGNLPDRTQRRYRALAMLVSIFPLGLGLLWSFIDPDELCWHDRISRTFMTAR